MIFCPENTLTLALLQRVLIKGANKMNVEEKLINLFEDKGIYLSEQEKNDPLELDSIQFISIIVDIEQVYCIKIDDDYLMSDNFKTFNDYLLIVQTVLSKSNETN